MKNTFRLFVLAPAITIMLISGLSSCKKVYVVKSEDIQAYLAEHKNLDIRLPKDSYFELIDMDGDKMTPDYDSSSIPRHDNTAPSGDSITTTSGKKYRRMEAGVFGPAAFAQPTIPQTGYRCPPICEIVITTNR